MISYYFIEFILGIIICMIIPLPLYWVVKKKWLALTLLFGVNFIAFIYLITANFYFKWPNYDEHRIPLKYPVELISGEFGTYIYSSNANLDSINEMLLLSECCFLYNDSSIIYKNKFSNKCNYFKYYDLSIDSLECPDSPMNSFWLYHKKFTSKKHIYMLSIALFEFLMVFFFL